MIGPDTGALMLRACLKLNHVNKALSTSTLVHCHCLLRSGCRSLDVRLSIFSLFFTIVDRVICGIPYLAAISFLGSSFLSTSARSLSFISMLRFFLFKAIVDDKKRLRV
ncbi:hypothetical protein EGW08_021260 [Elysia chlorotica]|uniref:Uncharacterized protein n=1 Tax=Elysia chlorotica TaxID=188477 RepID=A0A433SP40_ELYCH|nr:hypothetical protein EGW08_021260 [Elysia chlorotica]